SWVALDPLDFALSLLVPPPETLYRFRTHCHEVRVSAPLAGSLPDKPTPQYHQQLIHMYQEHATLAIRKLHRHRTQLLHNHQRLLLTTTCHPKSDIAAAAEENEQSDSKRKRKQPTDSSGGGVGPEWWRRWGRWMELKAGPPR